MVAKKKNELVAGELQRRTQAEVEVPQERYFDFYDLAPVGYLTLTSKALIADANRKISKLLGVESKSLVGQTLTCFIFQEDQDRFSLYNKQLFTTDRLKTCELRLMKNSGGFFWVRLKAAGLMRENEASLCHIAVIDINDLKQAEDNMRRNAEIQVVLREISETVVLSSSLDELYRIVYRLIGRVLPTRYFIINLLDEAANEIVVPFYSEDVKFVPRRRPVNKGMTEYIMRLGSTVHLKPADMERLRETGEYKLEQAQKVKVSHYLGAPLKNSLGKPFGAIALVLLDDTQTFLPEDVEVLSIIAAQVSLVIERKRAEDELRESEEKFRYMTENSSDIIWHLDQSFHFTYISPADERMRGYTQKEVIGKALWSILKPEGVEYVRDLNAKRIADEQRGIARAAKYFTDGAYAAMLGFELDLAARELRYVGAGITQFYTNGRKMETPGMFVGIWSEAEFNGGTISVAEGDSFFFLSDGFTDALTEPENVGFFSSEGKDFGADAAALERLAENGRLRDDATGIGIRVHEIASYRRLEEATAKAGE